MAAVHSICATFRDFMGKQANVMLRKGTTLNDAEQWGEALKVYSRAALISVSHTETTYYDVDWSDILSTTSGEHYDRVEQKCRLFYTDADNGEKVSVSIPAPNDNCFDEGAEPTGDVAEDIKDAIGNSSTRESGNLIYRGGGLVSRLPMIRKATLSGV